MRLERPIEPVRLPSRPELVDWAAEHGIDLPMQGRIPDDVSDRYISYRLRARKRLMRRSS